MNYPIDEERMYADLPPGAGTGPEIEPYGRHYTTVPEASIDRYAVPSLTDTLSK